MKWPKFYLAAIVVHLLVLFGLTWHFATPVPPPEKHYLEVTLEAPPKSPAPTLSAPVPPPPQPTTELGLSPGKQTDNPNATPSDTASDKPASPPEAMARTPMAPTPDTPDSDMTRQAADKAGLDTPGIIGGSASSGPTGGGGGTNPYKVVAVPEGISWQDAEVAALAWGGRLAVLNTEKEEQFVFKLADDPQYWRDTDNGTLGPWLGGDFHFQPRYDPDFGPPVPGVDEKILPAYHKNTWGILFKGPKLGQRESATSETVYDEIANAFVVKFGSPVLRADVSIGKGHLGAHTFEVFAVPPNSPGINWLDAEEQARARGGYLAIIRTSEENNFVYNLTMQKPGAWRYITSTDYYHKPVRKLTYDLGPWIGGFRLFDQVQQNYTSDPMPERWRWFHFEASSLANGLSDDPILHLNLNAYANWIGDHSSGNHDEHPVVALHYVKLHTESVATWGMMHVHLFNPSYVVEYDDPPVTAGK
jgi:hypothetical protein